MSDEEPQASALMSAHGSLTAHPCQAILSCRLNLNLSPVGLVLVNFTSSGQWLVYVSAGDGLWSGDAGPHGSPDSSSACNRHWDNSPFLCIFHRAVEFRYNTNILHSRTFLEKSCNYAHQNLTETDAAIFSSFKPAIQPHKDSSKLAEMKM